MGIAKRLMQEIEDGTVRTAQWECPDCDTPNETYFDVPDVNFSSDDPSDYHGEEPLTIECENCGLTSDGVVINGVVGGLHFNIIGIDGEPILIETPGYDEYERNYCQEDWYWEPSDNPRDVFQVTIQGMENLLEIESPSEHDVQLLNRVIFSQIITALEAYLADTLINLVKGDKEIQYELYAKEPELKKVKFEAAKIIIRPHIPETYLVHWLQRKSFHDFPMADDLFKIVLGIRIYDDEAHEQLLNEAKENRHHCVHRNGKTKEGDKLDIFDKAYVLSVMEAAENLVRKIEGAIMAKSLAETLATIREHAEGKS